MKNARYMILLVAALALPYLIVGLFAGGPNAPRTFQAGLLMIVLAAIAFGWMIWRGKKVDPDADERERLILQRAMAFAFYVMLIAVGTYFMWPFASAAGASDASLWLVATQWGSFLVGYLYNNARM